MDRDMIVDPDDYFAKGCGRCDRFGTTDCSARLWADGLAALRRICREAGLSEQAKWGHPCYMHAGRNIVLMGAFRADFRLSFFNAALLNDPEGLLEKQGPNSRRPDAIRFTDAAQVDDRAAAIRAYLAEAMDKAERGIRPPRDEVTRDLPQELLDALDEDIELAEAFAALTRGRRNSYAVAIAGAKKPETRIARIAAFRDRILAGKGATER